MSIKLSILICTLPKRHNLFQSLLHDLYNQIGNSHVEVIWDDNEFDSIGEKRNRLLNKAKGKYLCFVDDDDSVSKNYIDRLLWASSFDKDCASLRGVITTDGENPLIFEHSIRYKEWKTNKPGESPHATAYERFPNHLNMIRSSIAKKFKFAEINHGEDFDWSKKIHESGLIKTEQQIPDIIYLYKYVTNK